MARGGGRRLLGRPRRRHHGRRGGRRVGRASAGIERGDILLAVNGVPGSTRRPTSSSTSTPPSRHAPHLHARPSRHATGHRSGTGGRAAGQLDVLRARGGGAVHAARRRVGAPEAAARSGDAAFLLAVRRLLRRIHLLVQRPVRSARLGVLLGRRRGAGAAAAAAAAFRAGLPAAAGRRALACAAHVRAAGPGLSAVFAGAGARRGARDRADPRIVQRRAVFAVIGALDRLEPVYLFFARPRRSSCSSGASSS